MGSLLPRTNGAAIEPATQRVQGTRGPVPPFPPGKTRTVRVRLFTLSSSSGTTNALQITCPRVYDSSYFFFRVLFRSVAQGEQGPENHLLLVEAPQKPLA